jgi:hypothetical protein
MSKRVNRIDELSKDIPPSRDLWPAIAAAIADQVSADLSMKAVPARRFAGWWPAAGLAASVALVAIGVLIGRQFGQPGNPQVAQGTNRAADPALIPASMQRDAEYRKQREELVVQVNAKLAAMPPAEREKVAASLATLRKSIQDIEAALGHDPANALLQELLVTSCQEEMRALTTVRDSGHQEI